MTSQAIKGISAQAVPGGSGANRLKLVITAKLQQHPFYVVATV